MFLKVLIANRGEIALRILKCLRKMQIDSVVIYHEADRDSPVVQQADEAVEIFGKTPTGAYLDIGQIIQICKRVRADAVHPGYGFLAENAAFAAALESANICFIGPSKEVIELMGDKIHSRDFVEKHGFPVPPSVTMDADEMGFEAAVIGMGFPLVVKASAGGGGKGMKIVYSIDELGTTLKIAASEAEKYFGDKRVYIERYFEKARHIEVQVLGDGKNVVHLWERECSIQRRFQKIIEESPSPALSSIKRRAICEAAVGIAKAANYSNAGTIEFLYTNKDEFFFLEMNTRIQVEHPVTEMVTGIDLVEEQIRIAAGQPLRLSQDAIVQNGHAIECRVCAEDAYHNFLPEVGQVLFLKLPQNTGTPFEVRLDSGLYLHQKITTAFDPMLAKLIVHAPTRKAAIQFAIQKLKELVILGIQTNADYLTKVLNHPLFRAGDVDTGFIKKHGASIQEDELMDEQIQALLTAAVLTDKKMVELMEITPKLYAQMGNWRN